MSERKCLLHAGLYHIQGNGTVDDTQEVRAPCVFTYQYRTTAAMMRTEFHVMDVYQFRIATMHTKRAAPCF